MGCTIQLCFLYMVSHKHYFRYPQHLLLHSYEETSSLFQNHCQTSCYQCFQVKIRSKFCSKCLPINQLVLLFVDPIMLAYIMLLWLTKYFLASSWKLKAAVLEFSLQIECSIREDFSMELHNIMLFIMLTYVVLPISQLVKG